VPPVAAKSGSSKRHLAANGRANPSSRTSSPKRPRNAFEVYCSDMRPVLTVENRKAIADGSFDVEKALAVGWQDIDEDQRLTFQRRFEESKKAAEPEKASEASRTAAGADRESKPTEEADEDVEMGDDGDSPPAGDAGGFTAVNRG
jgi:non-histone protein 10